jgi:hypothetical protein
MIPHSLASASHPYGCCEVDALGTLRTSTLHFFATEAEAEEWVKLMRWKRWAKIELKG